MQNLTFSNPDNTREQTVIDLTSFMVHKHYCENDVEAIISLFDEDFHWLGAAEQEYSVGTDTVSSIFRQFAGQVPKCNIYGEEYNVRALSPDIYLCTGRMWIATDPSTQVYLRVHQRITTVFRWKSGNPLCCHIHISNPYTEMAENDVGFPTQMAMQSYEYLQEQIERQKKLLQAKTDELSSIYNTVPCAIMRFLRTEQGCRLLTCNQVIAQMLGKTEEEVQSLDWSEGFCKFIDRADLPKLRASLNRLRKPGDQTSVDYQLNCPGQETVYLNCINSLISEDKKGQLIQRICFDISKRVQLESALKRISFEDSLTGLFNRNRFNVDFQKYTEKPGAFLGIACFDINGLKTVNDKMGHIAGDELIRRTAAHISQLFPRKAYRIGGDEFIILDDQLQEKEFRAAVDSLCSNMYQDGIQISAGCSWRSSVNASEQLNEADVNMYLDKKQFYKKQKTVSES